MAGMSGQLEKGLNIDGGTDGTVIGNVSDRLKVDAYFSSTPTVTSLSWPTFSAYAQDVTVTTSKSMISLLNAGGSAVKIRIRSIKLVNVQGGIVITGGIADFRLLRITGHSVGTSLTAASFDTSDSLNASVTARTGATVTGEGTVPLQRALWSTDEWGSGAQDVESNDHTVQSIIPIYKVVDATKPITLNAGEGITLKQTATIITGTFDIQITFTQET